MKPIPFYKWTELGPDERSAALRRPVADDASGVQDGAAAIIADVRRNGDEALTRLTREYDGVALTALRVSADEIGAAAEKLTAAEIDAIDLAIANVRCFHEAQRPEPIVVETMPGVTCERLSHPIAAVGLYVPAGSAPLPSAAVMLAVPAAIAGCPLRILCTPPRSDGTADPAVLVAASRAGVTEIYKVGGAQAVAAMAYGTETVPKVAKIFGPGNAWVTAAKTLVSADPDGAGIDMPAGPSEVLVIADANASAAFVASDMLAQAEHGTDSQAVLVTTSEELARAARTQLRTQLRRLSRATIAGAALSKSCILIVDDIPTAIAVSNDYAPEHLILQIDEPRSVLGQVRNAGSVFVGPWTPESVGDYCSGTNHVLPTYGFAKNHSGLGLDQFMRQMTIQELTREGLENLGEAVVTLAGLEGLDAHAASVTRRLRKPV
jgi:histidinol dehydrogenase